MTERTRWQRVAKRIRVPLGFVFAAAFLTLAHPTWGTLGWSLPLVAPGVWLRGYASGYVKKNAELTVTGPYAYTRNPLYLGSMMIAFGFAGAAASWIVFVALAGLFAAIYLPTIRGEEAYLREHFTSFDAYVERVPRLLPRVRVKGEAAADGGFSRSLYLKHREYNCVMGAAAIYAALMLRLLYWPF